MKKNNRMSWVYFLVWPAIIAVTVGALIVINQLTPKSKSVMPTNQNTPPTSTTATK